MLRQDLMMMDCSAVASQHPNFAPRSVSERGLGSVTPTITPSHAPRVAPRLTAAPPISASMCRTKLISTHLLHSQSLTCGSKGGSVVGVNGLRL